MSLKALVLFQLVLVLATAQSKKAKTYEDCLAAFDYYYDGYCYSYCPSGTYSLSYGMYMCQACPSKCGSCVLNSTTETPYCTSCSNGLGMTAKGDCFDIFDLILKPLIVAGIFLGSLFTLRAVVEVFNWAKARRERIAP